MPLGYDSETREILYEGRVVGRYDYENGKVKVSLNLTYECTPDEWILPLESFANGLSRLAKHRAETIVLLSIETDEAEIAESYPVPRSLNEKIVKGGGYKWDFHKGDPDGWPSALHAHEDEKNLKLDAITGDIYDATTRQRCERLSARELARIHAKLRQSNDFAATIAALLPQ
jgi:hypothetical protein